MHGQPRAVLFDFFGTLSEAVGAERREALAHTLGCQLDELAVVLQESFYERAVGRYGDESTTMSWVAGQLGLDLSDGRLSQAVAVRRATAERNMKLREDAATVLTALRARGLRTAVVSDCTHELPARWPHLPVAPLVDATAFSIAVGACKPDPRIYLAATAALGLDPGDCLYVGDGGSRELTGATAVGMTAVRLVAADVRHHLAYDGEDDWSGPTVASLSEVLDLAGIRAPGRRRRMMPFGRRADRRPRRGWLQRLQNGATNRRQVS